MKESLKPNNNLLTPLSVTMPYDPRTEYAKEYLHIVNEFAKSQGLEYADESQEEIDHRIEMPRYFLTVGRR